MSEETKSQIFECISKNEMPELKLKLKALNGSVDFTDDNGKSDSRERELVDL
jgi:hypothetical protein